LRGTNQLNWDDDGKGWPNRDASQFVQAGGLRWHVQKAGTGPIIFLLHGTGAATHSWRALLPLLVKKFTVIAPDLPGHGFSEALPSSQMSLPGMARAAADLLRALKIKPALVVGHSAGAAILAQMCLDAQIAPHALVSLNGAMLPLRGIPGVVFSPVAKLMAATSFVPRLFAWRAQDPSAIARLISSTGSKLDPEGTNFYTQLIRDPGHVAATLDMMAQWDLVPLERNLPQLQTSLTLVVGANDLTVAPSEADRVKSMLPNAQIITLAGLGHLAHEEQPAEVAKIIATAYEQHFGSVSINK
jgi:magnesium chelatase accessory protein